MTLGEAITYVDEVKPNQYSKARKIQWLSKLDEQIFKEIIITHEHEDNLEFTEYNTDTVESTKLLVESPYDELYRYYLESQIDYSNQEISKFNNSIAMFNEKLNQYKNYYNRTIKPL